MRAYFGDVERCSVIQVLSWWTDRTADTQRAAFTAKARELAKDGSADALLVDSRSHTKSGGTGIPFNWAAAHSALRQIDYRLIVAGGLNPGNVGDAIRLLQPWGVDVASGVEAEDPGRKDPAKLAAFVEAARRVSVLSQPAGGAA